MADVEKVRRGIERCLHGTCPSVFSKEYEECEYKVGKYCGQDRLLWDILDLLKDVEPVRRKENGEGRLFCGNCGTMIPRWGNYCAECGRKVKR